VSRTYATGKHAIGECQRCGFVYKLSRLRPDGETNLMVCGACYDIKHPAERPIDVTDAVALRRPAPDLDAAAANVITDARPLGEVLFGAGGYFGEQP